MKNYILSVLCVISLGNFLFAQNTATNFTTEDCNGVMHNLYDSLDAGNIIVIAWVMPCGPCATYAGYAYSAVQNFSLSHPDKVDFYLVDDYANTNCASLVNWGFSNSMPSNTTFSSNAISMLDYGSTGMPKVVVLGGADYTVYYNENDDKINLNAVEIAINNALANTTHINGLQKIEPLLSVFPNPTQSGFLNVTYKTQRTEKITLEILNYLGEVVFSLSNQISNSDGLYNNVLDINDLSKGNYILKVETSSNNMIYKFLVSN